MSSFPPWTNLTRCRFRVAQHDRTATRDESEVRRVDATSHRVPGDLLLRQRGYVQRSSDNEAKILEHPVVQALATSDPTKQTTAFSVRPHRCCEHRHSVPSGSHAARAGRRFISAAVAAALAGSTSVIDGPPGTGKSQTIANMIGALLHSGKTVLFVSEKIAALEVVRNRLDAAGLGSYLLELHSTR